MNRVLNFRSMYFIRCSTYSDNDVRKSLSDSNQAYFNLHMQNLHMQIVFGVFVCIHSKARKVACPTNY